MTVEQPQVSEKIAKLIAEKGGINLDVGCGGAKQSDLWVGMDIRPLPGVDIVWDLEKFPWPIPDECASSCLFSHVIEHINPSHFLFVKVIDEAWRVLKPKGRMLIAAPYATSEGMLRDPTHCNFIHYQTFWYWDPSHESRLYDIYKPKPFKILANAWHSNGSIELVMEKLPIPEDYVCGYE